MQYRIYMPAKLYRALWYRDVFMSTAEAAELSAFKAAEFVPFGRGERAHISGDEKVVTNILGYVNSLLNLVDQGTLTMASLDLGVSKKDLVKVAKQPLVPVCG